jgi:hypothetical protein
MALYLAVFININKETDSNIADYLRLINGEASPRTFEYRFLRYRGIQTKCSVEQSNRNKILKNGFHIVKCVFSYKLQKN